MKKQTEELVEYLTNLASEDSLKDLWCKLAGYPDDLDEEQNEFIGKVEFKCNEITSYDEGNLTEMQVLYFEKFDCYLAVDFTDNSWANIHEVSEIYEVKPVQTITYEEVK